jgi:hypothetical protein
VTSDPDVDDLRALDAADRGYAESVASKHGIRQEVVYRDREGKLRILLISGIPTVDELVTIARDARFRIYLRDDLAGPRPAA